MVLARRWVQDDSSSSKQASSKHPQARGTLDAVYKTAHFVEIGQRQQQQQHTTIQGKARRQAGRQAPTGIT